MEGGGGFGARRRIDRKSSIESEPMTLSESQIQCAREAALYVMNTRSIEEAIHVFTEGLEPVVDVAQSGGTSVDFGEEFNCCMQSELQLPRGLRDVVSAPF